MASYTGTMAVFNVCPNFCPMCGTKLNIGKDSMSDFYHDASFTCDCGFHFQQAPERIILQAAEEAGGDMKYRAQ